MIFKRRQGAGDGETSLLTPERIRIIGVVFAVAWLLILCFDIWTHTRHGLVDAEGQQLGRDFVNSWAAPRLAQIGPAEQVYAIRDLTAFERGLTAPNAAPKFYSYPPTYLLLTTPISLPPFLPAYLLWIAGGWALLIALLRPFLGLNSATMAVLASPAVFMNTVSGQNGALTTGAFVGGLMLLERRPVLAGAVLGLLSVKPQLALLVPIALLSAGQLRALLAMGFSALLLAGLSVLAYGVAPWLAFFHNFPTQKLLLDLEPSIWQRMPTVYSAVRLAGGAAELAYAVQLAAAGFSALCVIVVWRRSGPMLTKAAILILASLACTPYAWDYDSIAVLFAAIWLWRPAPGMGANAPEKLLLAILVAGAALAPLLANVLHLQIAPLCLLALLAIRALKPSGAEDPAAQRGEERHGESGDALNSELLSDPLRSRKETPQSARLTSQ